MITYALSLLLIQAKKSVEFSSLKRQRQKAKDPKQEFNSNERQSAKLAGTIDLNDSLNNFGRKWASSTASKNGKNRVDSHIEVKGNNKDGIASFIMSPNKSIRQKGDLHIEAKGNNADKIASFILSPNNSLRNLRDSPLNSGNVSCKSSFKIKPGIKSIDLREMRESTASLKEKSKKVAAQGIASTNSSIDRVARQERKKVAARKLLRKMRCTQISSALLTLIATSLTALIGATFLTVPGSVRDYYAPDIYDPIYDAGNYCLIGVLYFFVYYSWIHTPDWATYLCHLFGG
mmetsp:Transcript_3666/g.5000  ORF Transcript_3666/g.5000 Transcript_3666/m.5000 type:complete len:290 (-) Transcript_3666:445-1314(-)